MPGKPLSQHSEIPDLTDVEPAGAADGSLPPKSASTADRGDEAYAVGYRRPPLQHRFKPGQSGNPKGRAKQSRNLRTVIHQVMGELMQVREGDRLRRMPASEALVRNTFARALKGDPKAMRAFLILLRQAGYGVDEATVEADPLVSPEIDAIVDDFFARGKEGKPAESLPPKRQKK